MKKKFKFKFKSIKERFIIIPTIELTNNNGSISCTFYFGTISYMVKYRYREATQEEMSTTLKYLADAIKNSNNIY